jgi:hypothetical protein
MSGLGVALLDLLLGVAGLGILRGLGLAWSRGDLVRLGGLAFLVGFAVVGVALSIGLTVGLPASVAVVTVVAGAVALLGLRPRSRRIEARRVASTGVQLVVGAVAALVGVAYLALLLRAVAGGAASAAWDAWGFWVPKAKTIYFFGGLDAAPGGITSFANPEYPPMLPALDASVFAFARHADAGLLPVQEWLLLVAFVWAAAGLLWRRVRVDLLWVGLLLVVLMPTAGGVVGASLGDLPLALLVGLALLCVALWQQGDEPRYLAVAAILLAAAAVAKQEGLSQAAMVAAASLAAGGRRRWRGSILLAAAAVAAVVPWRLWLRAHDVLGSGAYRPRDLLDPGYLADRAGRATTAAPRVASALLDVSHWGLVLPLALALAVLLAVRRHRLATLPLVFVALEYCGLVAVYWISFLPIGFHLDTSVDRAVMPIVFGCAALLPLLLGEALSAEQRVRGAPEPVLEPDRRLEAEYLARG